MESSRFNEEWTDLVPRLDRLLARKGVPLRHREDLIQDTGMKLWGMWARVDPERPLWPLATTIALNTTYNQAAKAGREVACDFSAAATRQDVEHEALTRIELRRTLRSIAGLRPSYRSALVAEIADGSRAHKVVRLRARRALSRLMEGAGVGWLMFRGERFARVAASAAAAVSLGTLPFVGVPSDPSVPAPAVAAMSAKSSLDASYADARLEGRRVYSCAPLNSTYMSDIPTKEEIKEEVNEALKSVLDPELGIDIVNLGLVYEIDVSDDNNVKVDFTLTTMGCPIGPMISEQIEEVTAPIEGIGAVTTELVMYPPWTPEKMSPLARSALGIV